MFQEYWSESLSKLYIKGQKSKKSLKALDTNIIHNVIANISKSSNEYIPTSKYMFI